MDNYREACQLHASTVAARAARLQAELRATPRKIVVFDHVRVPLQYMFQLGAAFASHPAFDYTVMLDDSERGNLPLFQRHSIPVQLASTLQQTPRTPDLLFIQHPYYNIGELEVDFYGIMGRLPLHVLPREAAAQPLLCYSAYAYCVINDAYHPINGHYNLPIHNIAWRVFGETEWHRGQAQQKSAMGGANWVALGYPKLDWHNPSPAPRDAADGVRRIIWSPHHNASFQVMPIIDVHRAMVALAQAHPQWQIIFRPHPNLLRRGFDFTILKSTQEEFDQICSFWQGFERGEFNMTTDLAELFCSCDLMVTNCAGFHVEFLPAQRPLISYMPDWALNQFARDIKASCHHSAATVDEISALVQRILVDGIDDKQAQRQQALQLVQPFASSSQAIVDYIASALLG